MVAFESNKKSSSILDCFTYNLTSFFYDDYEEIDSEETPATVMIVYEKKLPWIELEIFDAVQFRIFFDKESITGSNPVNVKFISEEKFITSEDIQKLIDKISQIYGNDNYGKIGWDEDDERAYLSKTYRKVWTIEHGESFVSIEYNETDGITLNILFFNNLMKEPDKSIEAN